MLDILPALVGPGDVADGVLHGLGGDVLEVQLLCRESLSVAADIAPKVELAADDPLPEHALQMTLELLAESLVFEHVMVDADVERSNADHQYRWARNVRKLISTAGISRASGFSGPAEGLLDLGI